MLDLTANSPRWKNVKSVSVCWLPADDLEELYSDATKLEDLKVDVHSLSDER